MDKKDYDLIVIGGGPAGIAGAATAAGFGKNVALIDSHHELGGAGVNTGTAPSKTLRETALALSGARSRNLYGVDLSLRKEATVADFLRHERNVKTGLNMFVMEMRELSVRLRKEDREFSLFRACVFIGGFDSDEKLVPFKMFAGGSGSSSREGLIQQNEVSDLIRLHQEPVGKRATTEAANLVPQQLDRAIENSVIVRLNNAMFGVID
jgi:hypothetical protein